MSNRTSEALSPTELSLFCLSPQKCAQLPMTVLLQINSIYHGQFMLMHRLTDQLSAIKENAQRVNSKSFPCCIVRGGNRERALLHPATSFLEICELPTLLLHSLGNVQWIQNMLTIGKNWQIPWLQNLHLLYTSTKKWE